ncbi:hypothetical protein PP2015_1459 [Pseudoalteromonas phenolica]|uniref:Uncharacterized protein n=2 Tax=Pseudoalteromonas phenolica TaxID=161398 RepID=A0A0S2K0Y5_9GAMM|nr:hypothetical protein PP2015_1459 [Pseudoalteromonas phenolica]
MVDTMKKNKIIIGLVIFGCISIWYFSGSIQNNVNEKNTELKTAHIPNQDESVSSTQEFEKKTEKPTPISFEQPVVDSAKIIAIKYKQSLNYPPYSQPLSLNDFSLLNPNYFEPITMVTQDSNVTISMALEKYHFVAPEPIKVRVSGAEIYAAKIKVQDTDTRKTISNSTMQYSEGGYVAEIKGDSDYPIDLQITVLANVNGDDIPLVAQVKYNQKSAIVTGVKEPYVDGSDLAFPVSVKVEKAGLYRLRANLFSAQQPIASLVSQARLETGQKQIILKAHQSIVPNVDSFELSTFTIEKRSTHPSEPSRFGSSAIDTLSFENVDTSSLNRTAYVPSDNEKKRLSFLQNLAKTN